MCLVTIVLADYFGRGALGTLRGITAAVTAVAGGLGPVLVGFTFDRVMGYGPIFLAIGVAVLICAGLSIAMRPPRVSMTPGRPQISEMPIPEI